MEQDKKNVIKLIGIMIIYILLSALGIFSQIEIVLLPIVAVPYTLFCMRNKVNIQLQVLFHAVVGICIYLISQSLIGVLIYLVSVVIPAYIILVLYNRELPLPNIIMNGGIILSVVVFGFLFLMKQVGLDYERQYGAALDLIHNEFVSIITSLGDIERAPYGASAQMSTQQITQAIDNIILVLKKFYGTIIVSQVTMSFSISVLIINLIARRKNKNLPSTKQILEYRISKFGVLLLLICMLISDFYNGSEVVITLALNIIAFLASIIQIAGFLSLIALLKRFCKKSWLRILGYIGVVMLFMLWPELLMFYGCLDALFNYRKVSIVV